MLLALCPMRDEDISIEQARVYLQFAQAWVDEGILPDNLELYGEDY